MKITTRKRIIGLCLLGLIGLLIFVIGLAILLFFPAIFKAKLQENLIIAEGKEVYNKWKKAPIPLYFSVYLFNCTNPIEVEMHGEKPVLKEVGPYVFKELRSKNVLSWNFSESTVTYDDIKSFHFEDEISADPEQMIYTLNLPMLGFTRMVDKMSYFSRSLVAPALNTMFESYQENLFIHQKVRTLLFEGYKIALLDDLLNMIKPFVDVSNPLPNNTFGFFYGKNNTGDGVFSIYTGQNDMSRYIHIKTWNNISRLPWWKDEYCDMINGTDGAQFAPPISKNDTLYLYSAELCRSIFLEFVEEVDVKNISALRFSTPERLFANSMKNPNNKCFCTTPNICHWNGLLLLSPCRKGLPLAVSAPHFYEGHSDHINGVIGLKPSKELHKTYIDIEPTTGFVLNASRKLQMNYLLENSPHFKMTEKLSQTVFPLLWLSESAEISDNIAAMFIAKMKTPIKIVNILIPTCIIVGVLMITTTLTIVIYSFIKHRKIYKSELKTVYLPIPLKSEIDLFKREKNGLSQTNSTQ